LPEAEALYRQALAVRLKALGEGHPQVGQSYNNLAFVLRDRGKLPEAEALYRQALAVRLKALGEDHPDTAASYRNLGLTLARLGKADEALDALTSAVHADDLARLWNVRGLEAAAQDRSDPSRELAVALARTGRAADAWGHWERGLARGVLDETAGRAARPLTTEEHAAEADLLGRSQAVDERISRLAGRPRPTQEDEKRLVNLRDEASELRGHLLDHQQALGRKYGPLAGAPVALDEARAALSEDAALVGWVDTDIGHGACAVRRSGAPAWVLIPGAGAKGDWTKDEVSLAQRLRDALAARAAADELRPLAEALARQRLGPLEAQLKGVRRVVVVNSQGLAGVPVEVLFAARGDAGRGAPVVAYAPSVSMFTYLKKAKIKENRPAALLALGDPAYPEPAPDPKPPPPPDHGLFDVTVVPNGNADLFGIKPDDVLLEYNGTPLKTRADLKVVAADGGPKKVPVKLWRAGETRAVEVAAGPLGVRLDNRPAAPVVLAHREADAVLAVRGESPARLPGTRREVAAIAGLFPAGKVTTVLGGEARESVVQGMAREGKLKNYKYLHFAAHGRYDPRSAYRTALLLAPDPERSADPAAFETDGEISAEQIARTWDLDADLVVLSACESGLGKQAGGEGFLGFAQPLLAKGARSLVLSLWKVDDRATSLLMARFYRNLLGQRPMPRAEALDEAKRWLRGLSADEVGGALEALERGPVRPLVTQGGAAPATRPFEHPYYWAAFVLIGDPS
jgi:CHAT domain-containing protein